jgi:hypothetical protein
VTHPTIALTRHSLRRFSPFLALMVAVLFVFQVLVVVMAGTFQELGTFDRITALIPPFIRQFLGSSLLGVFTFPGICCVGYFHVAIMAWLVGFAIAVGTEPTSEIERGFTDLVLARPIPRRAIVTRTALVLLASTTLVVAAMVAGTWVGLETQAPPGATWPSPRLVASLAVNLWALAVCWGGLAAAVGATTRRRAVGAGITTVAAFSLFLADYVARAWQPAQAVARFSPFRYYNGMELVAGAPLPAAHLAILGGAAVSGFLAAYILFARRDI